MYPCMLELLYSHRLRQRLAEEYADCSALFQRGLQQLNEVAAVLYNLRAEQEAISAAVSHENEKGDLLMNILGSLLQEVRAQVDI